MKRPHLLLLALLILAARPAPAQTAAPALGMGQLCGEVTTASAVLQARLSAGTKLAAGDLPGARGWGRFELAASPQFTNSTFTPWAEATPERDFIIKQAVTGLKPATRYHYRLVYGPGRDSARTAPACAFRTLGGGASVEPVSIAVVTGMNYAFYHHGTTGIPPRPDADPAVGYPALASMLKLAPDYFVGTGDNVYYDAPPAASARTEAAMRRKWHEQFVQSRFHDLFASVATYWEKDDHDYRYNDADLTGKTKPSNELGRRVFFEQLPLADFSDAQFIPYRTFRVSKDLQIWLTEGREFRSPNAMPDGPNKTLWGLKQREWLKRTLLASDATFKILISPTALIGPDTAAKLDSHANLKGFYTEGREFIGWLKKEKLLERNFYVICGDRHWQYHSIDPSGLEEFCTGALVRENGVVGAFPGQRHSNDPEGKIRQPYHPREPMGGYLILSVRPAQDGKPATATVNFYDEEGKAIYTVEKAGRE